MSVLLTPLIKSNVTYPWRKMKEKKACICVRYERDKIYKKKFKHTDLDIEFKINNLIELNLKTKTPKPP